MKPLALAVAGLLATSAAHAELEYGVEVGVGYSDNVLRAADDEVSSTVGTLGLDLTWREQRRTLNADVRTDLTYYEYLEDGIDSHLGGNANGMVSFGIIPERFTWDIEDTLGQSQRDPLLPATPETTEFINYFSTGPSVMLRMGSVGALRLQGRYGATTYENSPFDSTRMGGGLAYVRELSPRSNFSLGVNYSDVDFDEATNPDFTSRSASLSYALEGARTDIDAELGYTWVERDTLTQSEQTGPLVRIQVRREIATSNYLSIRFGTQLADAAEAMRTGAGAGAIGGEQGSGTSSESTFENRFATVTWQFDRPRTSLNVSANYDRNEYETQSSLDRERMVYGAAVTRHLTNRLRVRGGAFHSVENFSASDSEAKELRLNLGVVWNFGRVVGMEVFGERIKRDADTESAGGHSVENRVFLTLFYRPEAR